MVGGRGETSRRQRQGRAAPRRRSRAWRNLAVLRRRDGVRAGRRIALGALIFAFLSEQATLTAGDDKTFEAFRAGLAAWAVARR